MKRFGLKLLCGAAAFFAPAFAQISSAGAAEEYEAFLQGLRDKQYYDTAVEYLEAMKNSPLLNESQKQMIPYEAARTNLEAARSERDNVAREKLLDDAKAKFEEFVTKNPEHLQAAGAATQMGVVLIERGRAKVEQGLRPEFEKQKTALMTEARKFFDESEKVFVSAEAKFKAQLDKFEKFIPVDDPRHKERERVKGDLVQAHMFHAKGLYEKSRTYPDQSAEWKQALVTAAEKYGSIYRDYRTLIAGLAARLQEGQCYQELKDMKRALGLYSDLLGQPDGPEMKPLRPYKASALYLSLQCWIADSEKMYELASIQADEFIKGSSTQELQRPEWLAVRYYGAVANKLFAAQFGDAPKGEDEKKKAKALDSASEYAQVVASVQNEYQDMARGLLKEMGASADPTREPKTFLEAQTRGTEDMTKYSAAIAEATKPDVDPAVKEAKLKEAEAARESALVLFYKALALADNTVSFDDKNMVRYYICYMLYTQGKLYDAAVIGEFLLKFYPNSGGARSAAQIALAGYVNEYQLNQEKLLSGNGTDKPVDPEFDRKKMYGIASEITKRWKGAKEADDAWNILLAIAINEKNVPAILSSLENIQETAPLRSDAEMRAATALWSLYSLQLTLDDGAPSKLPAAEQQKLAVDTNAILEKTFAREKGKIADVAQLTLQHADALRYLCESRIATGQNAKALEGLLDPVIGLDVLVAKKAANPAATVAPIPLETFKLLLQAYVLNNQVAKAQELTTKLANYMTPQDNAGGDANEQLAGTYLNLALRLDKQIEQYRATKNIDGIKASADGFAFFLDQVQLAYLPLRGDEAPEQVAEIVKKYQTLAPARQMMAFQNGNWASENLYKLGLDLFDVDKEKAVDLLIKSGKIDDALGNLAKPTSDERLIVKLRKAKAMRRAGKFVAAVDALAEVLSGRRNLMEAQVEAAETLMARAASAPGNAVDLVMYTRAIEGSRFDKESGENIIWGWKRIADTMRRIPAFQAKPVAPTAPAATATDAEKAKYATDLAAFTTAQEQYDAYRRLFHVARYGMAQSYYQHAQSPIVSREEKTKLLNSVTYTNGITKDIDPELGGPEWQTKYKELNDKATAALPK